jgi:FkbM family methyltransferase
MTRLTCGVLGGRSVSRVVKEIGSPRNYLALARIAGNCPDFLDVARRYLFGGGTYPYRCRVRTPLGLIRPTLYSHHDVWTVVEIFCREDYRAPASIRVVVDVGSNIGFSALYFLTRNSACRCYLYEPDPRNVSRLRENLFPYSDRWQLQEAAVGPEEGTVGFGREPTGRYGAVGLDTPDRIDVRCLEINGVLEDVLARESEIDLLKVDTEGLEESTVTAIRPEILDRIAMICFESERPARLHEGRFAFAYANETVRLTRRRGGALTPS